MNSVSRTWIRYIDGLNWVVYLGVIALISLLSGSYVSQQWLMLSGYFYGYATLYCFTLVLGAPCNTKALYGARYAIGFCVMALLWLWLQSAVPIDTHLYARVFSNTFAFQWFDPSLTWSVVPNKTRWLLLSYLFVFLLFILSLCLIHSRRRVKQLLLLFVVIGTTHAVIGILAKYANLHLVNLDQIDGHYDVARAWFVNRNHFATFIGLCLIGSVSLQLKVVMKNDYHRFRVQVRDQFMSARMVVSLALLLALALALLLGVTAIILSQSRAGFISLLLSVLLVSLVFRNNSDHALVRRGMLVFAAFVMTALLVYFGDALLGRFDQGVFSAGERFEQWMITWSAIKQELLLGYGGGSYGVVFQVFREYADLRQVYYDQAHNEYLHIWLEQGLVGLVLWLGFVWLALQRVLSSIRKHPSSLVVAVSSAGLIVLIAVILQALVGYSLQIINIRSYFFVIIALVFAAPKIKY